MNIPNTFIKLDYNPVKDVLYAEWPEIYSNTIKEAEYTLDKIIESVRLYDVRFLLTDSRKKVIGVPELQYRNIVLKFAKDLMSTRVQKVGRVVRPEILREEMVEDVAREAQLTFPVRSFTSVEEALAWLT